MFNMVLNLDDGILDGLTAMQTFANIAIIEPEVSKRPLHYFFFEVSPKFDIVLTGSKSCQGKPIINPISLKVGEELFIEHVKLIRKHGAIVAVVAFGEHGQAATGEDKVRIRKRPHDIGTNSVLWLRRRSVARWPWRYRTCIWTALKLATRNSPSVLRQVLFHHKPGSWTARLAPNSGEDFDNRSVDLCSPVSHVHFPRRLRSAGRHSVTDALGHLRSHGY
jgi:hypothetical protein